MPEAVVCTRSTLARRAGWWSPAAQRMPEAAPACSGHSPLRSARPQALYHHPAPEPAWLQLLKVWAPSTQGEQRSWSRSSVLKPQPSWLSVRPKPRNASPAVLWQCGWQANCPQGPPLAVWPSGTPGQVLGKRLPFPEHRGWQMLLENGGSGGPHFPTYSGLLQESALPTGWRAQRAKQAQGSLTSQALTCIPRVPAEGQRVKLFLPAHAEVIVVGLQRTVVRVQEIHAQLGAQARLGGQARDVVQPQPVVTCRGRGCCATGHPGLLPPSLPWVPSGGQGLEGYTPGPLGGSYLSGLRSPVCTPASTSRSPEACPGPGLGSESLSSHRPGACHREPGERAGPWQALPLSCPRSLKHCI